MPLDDVFRLIIDNIFFIVIIIIALSQLFTQLRTGKNPDADTSDSLPPFGGPETRRDADGDTLEDIIRRLQEQSHPREQSPATPPPLPQQPPPQQPARGPQKLIPPQKQPQRAVVREEEAEHVRRLVPDNISGADAYSMPAEKLPMKELERLREQARTFEKYLSRGGRSERPVDLASQTVWRALLSNPASARQAVILREVLSPPVTLR